MFSELNSVPRTKVDEVPFTVRARVAMQLGRESISSSIVAIVELVKNAFDADADNVWITFSNMVADDATAANPVLNDTLEPEAPQLQSTASTLVIDDDGSGMTSNQVKQQWMVIGTDNKAQTRRSSGKSRTLVGEKGLGRLGLDRLAHLTRMQTFSEAAPESGVELEIKWEEYETHSSDPLDTIRHSLYTIPKLRPHGTTLILEGLKDAWTSIALFDLRKDLSLLVSPFDEISDFKIWLNGESVSSPEVLDVAHWKVNAILSKEDESDRWVSVYELTDPEERTSRTVVEWRNLEGQIECECGPIKFEMYFYPRDDVKSETGETLFTRGQIVDFLDSNQGVRIYRDGFRVKPYGDPDAAGEGDWLGLNMRRVRHPSGVRQEGRWRVAYNQVVGAVFISKEANPKLIDQTNREGLVEGAALSDLRVFALNVIDFFEERRQAYERSRSQQSAFDTASHDADRASEEARQTAEKAVEALRTIPQLHERADTQQKPQSDHIDAAVAEAQQYVNKLRSAVEEADRARENMKQAYQERERAYEEKENTLANLASLGILAAFFGHETVAHTNRVITNITLLKESFEDIRRTIKTSIAQEIERIILVIEGGAARIQTFAKFTIGNVRTDKRHRKLLDIVGVAKDVVEAFELGERNIAFELTDEPKLPSIYAFRIDWESILINLLTNAVWALEGTDAQHRIVQLQFWADDENLHFTCDDSGRGIEPGTIDRIFEPVFSTRRNARGDIVGTGMGLSIVQNLVRNYQGAINAKYNGELGGASFHIIIPLKPNTRSRKNGHQT